MANNYDINYNDERFTEVESEKNTALNKIDSTYDNMINASDKYYQDQIDASKDWAEKQSQLQQEQTDFTIEKIEHQKELAKKDYLKEQSGAYVDWQKQSNQYGANAEAMAAQGMAGTGYSESSQVSMYNTYQNRITTARESYNNAIMNYNNAITEARLQNNSLLAEIAYNALQQQLELSLQGFQYKNQLILDKTTKRLEVDTMYHNRYQDVLAQINHENALAEEVRQYNESLAEEKRQYNESKAMEQAKLEEQKRQFDAQIAEEQRRLNQMQIDKDNGTFTQKSSSKKSSSVKKGTSEKNTIRAVSHDGGGNFGSYSQSNKLKESGAYDYLNALIASGANNDKISNEITLALRNGAITRAEATKLRNAFTPVSVQY